MFHYKKTLLLCISLLLIISSGCTKKVEGEIINRNPIYSEKDLLVHFIDVGQGDAILIQINNKNLLIDSGPVSSSNKLIEYLKDQRVSKLDTVLATHPHEDHIGNMDYIINHFKVSNFYAPKKSYSSDSFKAMVQALKKQNLKINTAKAGVPLDLGKGIILDIIAPIKSDYDELNNYSAVLKITYGSTKFLFMGDAEKESESQLIASKQDLSADVIKLGHHGSNSSSSLEFLNKVSPSYAIISCGKFNDYGHPHVETLNNLKSKNITTYRTDIDKTILLKSDGSNILKIK
jgi:competence protein ComEC